MEGVGVQVKHASIITIEEENLLWEQGVLSLSNPLDCFEQFSIQMGKFFVYKGERSIGV